MGRGPHHGRVIPEPACTALDAFLKQRAGIDPEDPLFVTTGRRRISASDR
jgi:hypothetical protein